MHIGERAAPYAHTLTREVQVMNKPQEPARPGGRRSRLSGMPAAGEPRLALSGLVHRALLSFQERDQQRRRLINMLILAQALLFIATAPAYIGSAPALPI